MRLTVKTALLPDEIAVFANRTHLPLSTLVGAYQPAVVACLIDGEPVAAWGEIVPQDEDVTLFLAPQDPISLGIGLGAAAALGGTGFAVGASTAIGGALIAGAIGLGISTVLSGIAQLAFGPKPISKEAGNPQEAFGIAGLTNTVARGTPKFIPYGQRRVFGHIIGTKTEISADGRSTTFGVLYSMGDVGPAGIESITEVEINDTPLASFSGASFDTRLGTAGQSAITAFPSVSQVFSDGRTLPMDPSTITYTTRRSNVDSVMLTLFLPYLFNVKQSTGEHTQTKVDQRIEFRKVGDPDFILAPGGNPLRWEGLSDGPIYRPFAIALPEQAQWEIRLRAIPVSGGTNEGEQQAALFNVQEETGGSLAYPNNALLAVFGIGSTQISSFESMRISGLVKGRKVKIWDGAVFTTAWTRKRTWIIRDLLTEKRTALGNRIPESLIDDDAFLTGQNYYDETVDGETRDLCDIIVNDRRAGSDWIKDLLGEGRATIIPSGGKLKYLVNQPKSPNLLYAMPGNIIEGSMAPTWGGGGSPPNVMRAQYPDEAKDETMQVVEYVATDIGSEDKREEAVTLRSIIRRTQAYREIAYLLKRRRQVKRHWAWASPMGALVSEPFDVDSLSYKTVNRRRGYSGFCPAGSTTTNLLLDALVTLAAATTYSVLVHHLATNTVERKIIATAAGTWGQVAPTVAFTTAPAEGDIWAIGAQNLHLVDVLIEQVSRQADGTFVLQAAQYDATIYDSPGAPPGPPPGAPPIPSLPQRGGLPLPLDAVTAIMQIDKFEDGGEYGWIWCGVTPGTGVHAGTAQAGGTNTITLATTEPPVNDFFIAIPATIEITGGTGIGQTQGITAYVGATRVATVGSNWTVIPDATSTYTIRFGPHDAFWGFDVELRDELATLFIPLISAEGTTGSWEQFVETADIRTIDFQFIPIGISQARNRTALWSIPVEIQASLIPPGDVEDF